MTAFTMDRSIYTKTARFDGSARALTEDELRRLAPSVFAVEAHESRSDRFKPIPTYEVVQGLQREGFSVVGAKQAGTRDESKVDFTKHMLRLRRLDDDKLKVGDSVFEILLKNANDGTSAYDLFAGFWRILCANSLVCQTANMDVVKVRHSGDVAKKVIEGTYTVLDNSQRLLEAPKEWGTIQLDRDEQEVLAKAAHALRFDEPEAGEKPAINPNALLVARRQEDTGNSLWKTFNRVQENVIKGGLTGRKRDANNNLRRVTTREVKGIDQDVKLNKGLWTLAEFFASQRNKASA